MTIQRHIMEFPEGITIAINGPEEAVSKYRKMIDNASRLVSMTELEITLEFLKGMRDTAEENARQKAGEAGQAVRRAAEVEALCAIFEEKIRELNGKERD